MRSNLFTIVLLLLSIFIFSCKQQAPDLLKTESFIEEYIKKTSNGDFSDLSSYYSDEMKNGEDEQTRKAKIQQLNDALGQVVSFEKIAAKEDVLSDGQNALTVIYQIKHKLMSVTETFTVKDENGTLKIAKQNIESVH